MFDRSSRGKIAVAGGDRRTYLHAMLTNDVATLQAGSGCYAAYLTPQGRMIADMRVLELGDMVLLDLDDAAAPAVLQKLDQFVFGEDVQFGDLGAAFGRLCVAGPAAARVVVVGAAGRPRDGRGGAGRLARVPERARGVPRGRWSWWRPRASSAFPRFDLYVERPHVEALRAALVAAGACPGDEEAAEVLRIEAGRPAFGADMDAETIPLEAGIEARAISFTKGCYPGQEVVIRVLHRGQGRVARKIVGLRVTGEATPARGDIVRAGDRDVGRVTSAAWSPRASRAIALAMLHRDFLEPGTARVDPSRRTGVGRGRGRTAVRAGNVTDRPPTIVTAAVVERNGRLLVARRLKGSHMAGFWEFPGGKCEPGETPEDCLARELVEELGVRATIGEEIYRTTYAYADRVLDLRFFRCLLDDEPRPLLGQEVRWVPRAELATLEFPPADAELVARLALG